MRSLSKEDIDKSGASDDREFRLPQRSEASDQDRAIRRVAEAVHRLNELIVQAIKTGVSVELMRVHRHHDGTGNWGDQMVPLVRQSGEAPGKRRGTEISLNPRDGMP